MYNLLCIALSLAVQINNDAKSKGEFMKRKIVGVVLSILLIVVMGAVALSGFIMHRNAESEEPLDLSLIHI